MINVFDKLGNQKELLEDDDIQSGNNYIKFPDGTLICWFHVYLEAGTELKECSFPEPFISAPKCFAFHEYAHQAYGFATTGAATNVSVNVYLKDETEGFRLERNGSVIAIGRWK